jgi:oligosaccharide repeat unit polymerase
MLLYFPFIFFFTLTFYYWKKKGYIDVAVFLFAEYALTSFAAILCVKMDLLGAGGIHFTKETLQLNFAPTLLYCLLPFLILRQFTKLDIKRFNKIHISNQKIFYLFTYFLFAVALLNIYVVIDNVISVLVGGDFAEIRANHYAGNTDQSQLKSLPKLLGYFYYFNRSTLLALPCFFYSICFLQKHWTYHLALFITALSVPLSGIQNADRTEFIFFAQTLILSLLLFRPYIHEKQKKIIKRLFIPLGIFFILYLATVTITRFVERDAGASGGALQYAGQSYLNFCYYYEFANNEHIYTDRMFPLLNHIISNTSYLNDIKDMQSDQQGFFVGVFPSFLGDFLLDTGIFGMLLWVLGFILITHLSFRFTQRDTISFGNTLWFYVLATIPMFGIFYYPYFEFKQGMFLVLTMFISIVFHYRLKSYRSL